MVRLALLGDPVAHSLSPVIHAAALHAAGIAGSYESRRVDAGGVSEAIQQLREGLLDGANVTMPHKRLAASLSDHLSGVAGRTGSVNTLVLRDGLVHGETTDVGGVRSAWGGLPPEPILLLGAGGAAAAALVALEGREIFVATRDPASARALVDAVGVQASFVDWGSSVPGAVVLNATPLGMHGESLPAGLLVAASGLFDMAYGPTITPAVFEASERGLPSVDGRQMLVAQAAISFQIWTGVEASIEAMAASLG